jgi:predicted nucleic acid-binding protein
LTEELSIDIESVLPQGSATTELKGLRGPLDDSVGSRAWLRYAALPLGLLLAAAGWRLWRRIQRRAQLQVRISAYDAAVQRLSRLAGRGWPSVEQADGWYVELSATVRAYIEDRYGVRAPELTTEEFLREARSQLQLQPANRELLEAFLATCDRVKFAGYRPGEGESRQALDEARRFLDDTRLAGPPGRRQVRR